MKQKTIEKLLVITGTTLSVVMVGLLVALLN